MADAPAPKGPKKCKQNVKDDNGNMLVCDRTIPKGQTECPNRREHLWPMGSGFCLTGAHEGTKTLGSNGKARQVCLQWKHCPCSCHTDLDELFAMSGKPRTPQENPVYHPAKNTYVIPTPEMIAADNRSSNPTGTPERVVVESPAPDIVPPTVARTFSPTPTGRSGRGQLELWVKEACDEFVVEEYQRPWTPAEIADWIIKHKGVATQSQGAVNAVFERWIKLGFAVIEKRPTRFVRYTEEGVRLGLDAMRHRAKQAALTKTRRLDQGIRTS